MKLTVKQDAIESVGIEERRGGKFYSINAVMYLRGDTTEYIYRGMPSYALSSTDDSFLIGDEVRIVFKPSAATNGQHLYAVKDLRSGQTFNSNVSFLYTISIFTIIVFMPLISDVYGKEHFDAPGLIMYSMFLLLASSICVPSVITIRRQRQAKSLIEGRLHT